jgi:1-deoxy-D-xylulose-5-phosphate reductoisomerase
MDKTKKRVAILGSTGSIGTQALAVIEQQNHLFEVEVLTANSNADLLIEQAIKYKPNVVVIGDQKQYSKVKEALAAADVKVFAGDEALCQVVEMDTIDIVLTALVGYSGLKPTLAAINAGKPIALANKETLVVAGEMVTQLARDKAINIYPVDSEHSAIFQCLQGEWDNKIEKIYLTASGGPFRGKDLKFLENVTTAQALKHPNWNMGAKITIDSASMMNKGLEMIEAKWLFSLKTEQIDVIVHPQSIVHSIVQFEDSSMKAQMGLPDMCVPIQYALAYPERPKTNFPRFNFMNYPSLTFETVDMKVFRNLELAIYAMNKGGNMPCILNAANEIAVAAFLNEKIRFTQMPDLVEQCMAKVAFVSKPVYDDYVATDADTRSTALELVTNL